MDKKSKMLLWLVFILIIISVAVTFWRIFIAKDYIIESQIDCDPTVDKCFIWECDPESVVEGEACTGDPENDIWYYKIASRKASKIPLCDPEKDETCDLWTCAENEKDCSVTLCDETTKAEQGVECSDPVQYNIDNPAEEEEVACEEGDTECEASLEEVVPCAEGDTECAAAAEEAAADETATACDPETEDCTDAATTDSVDSTQDQGTSDEVL